MSRARHALIMSSSLAVCRGSQAEHGAALPRGADEPLMTAAFVTYYFRHDSVFALVRDVPWGSGWWSERIQIRSPRGQDAGADGALDGKGVASVAAEMVAVRQVLVNVGPGELIQQQQAAADVMLLVRCQGWDDEAVADVEAELVSGAPARGVGVQPGPQALGLAWLVWVATKSSARVTRPLIPA
jgi:hypothetical protein